jgi:HPt (histidine-containing phosphotransfer) domain-containing protein
MTANVLSADMELYKKLGMVDYLGKPFTSKELWSCLLRHLQPVRFEVSKGKGDDDILLHKLKTDFAANNQDVFDKIKEAIAAGDITLAHRLAHTLKSSAGLIGKAELQKAAAEAESSLKNGISTVSDTKMNTLKNELVKVLDELRPFLERAEDLPESPCQPLDADAARKLLDKLEPMLRDSNLECVELISELRGIFGSGELIKQIEDFYFSDAVKILEKLKEDMEIL